MLQSVQIDNVFTRKVQQICRFHRMIGFNIFMQNQRLHASVTFFICFATKFKSIVENLQKRLVNLGVSM